MRLQHLLTLVTLTLTTSGAIIRLFPSNAGCPTSATNYLQCSGISANVCCKRNAGGIRSAGIYHKPRASQSAIYKKVGAQNRCKNQLTRYKGGNRHNVCVGSIKGRTVRFAGAAFFKSTAAKRDLTTLPEQWTESAELEARDEALQCSSATTPDLAVVQGAAFNLTGMPTETLNYLEDLVVGGVSVASVPVGLDSFRVTMPMQHVARPAPNEE